MSFNKVYNAAKLRNPLNANIKSSSYKHQFAMMIEFAHIHPGAVCFGQTYVDYKHREM